jgi:ABC-type proline/glycine betaine transport system permease subunit
LAEKNAGIFFEMVVGLGKYLNSNQMKLLAKFFKHVWKSIRNLAWALIVAFMLGVHNFYTGETKSKDDIVFTVEQDVIEEDSAPKD